ncbi:MAG: cyclophilin-like fold protein [Phascolarctobacterium sp.]|uniref:cyclophilin-like fold protein n=1 Tax=Phascolarctobacterium sp. TaxID=2049039 RepID=UPI0026DBB642|nr:cyclophilin-like fold protein [Phascolarctobacterium sp.]MDO4920642.1 cyclophilin-like fold protein [Phascolarctobacterium sp.]
MKKLTALLLTGLLSLGILGCASSNAASEKQNASAPIKTTSTARHKIKITVNGQTLTATLEDNSTTKALLAKMPMTLRMQDLYGREMCYHYGAGSLPTDELRSDGYQTGDIIYWPPRGSFVILYAQNGERFTRQHLGRIDSGVEIFKTTGDADVTFEILK